MAEVAGFNALLQSLAQLDFFSLLLPFLLSFVLFHFILQKLPIFSGDDENGLDDNKYSVIIALSLAFFVAYFLQSQPVYQSILPGFFGRTALGIMGLLGLMLLLAFAGVETEGKVPIVVILAVIAATAAFGLSGGINAFLPNASLPLTQITYNEAVSFLFDTGLIYLVMIGGAIWWLLAYTDEEDDSSESAIRNLVEAI